MALRYVREGARVCVADIAEDRLPAMQEELGDAGITVQADVRTMAENKKIVAACVEAFGKLDIFCPNAGLSDSFREFVDIPDDDVAGVYDELYDVNVKATLLGVKAALPELVKTEGCVVFTLSNSSFWPDGGGVMYISSKHAALGVMRQLAHEFAPVVRVNGVAPVAPRPTSACPSRSASTSTATRYARTRIPRTPMTRSSGSRRCGCTRCPRTTRARSCSRPRASRAARWPAA